ncbi:MAG: hypothetical protein K1X85_07065 [Ignavibacteria bacterium]|nr:hypothetical protein [Ignavibacteria bacterium]
MRSFVPSLLILLMSFAGASIAGSAKVRVVNSHDRVQVVTDPVKGYNSYPAWTLFPSKSIMYRHALLRITYQCPESLKCGEWDYIDKVLIRRKGGISEDTLNFEIARMISPYGSRFTSDWKFSWTADITDFAPLFHDSLEIEFIHTGYESNKDRGWLVTVTFELTEGTPAMELLGMEEFWKGNFPYGDTANSIESYLSPRKFKTPEGTAISRLRILQTGHGMDDLENCAEFCAKSRSIYLDGKLISRKNVWKECSDNPLFPQAGTWIFDRANWCPGDMVAPDILDLKVSYRKSHTLDINMEPYINRSKPTANYEFSSYIFHYSEPLAENDAGLVEIVAPTDGTRSTRNDPVCSGPAVVIKNYGRNSIRSLEFNYGTSRSGLHYMWTGELGTNESVMITLPGEFIFGDGEKFFVSVSTPNGMPDEYEGDNSKEVIPNPVPVYDKFIIAFRTNNDSTSSYCRIKDSFGNIVFSLKPDELNAGKLYSDTFSLRQGCYTLEVLDTAGDGLEFWFNPEGGSGFVRILDLKGRLIKSFVSDFGNLLIHNFRIEGNGTTSYTSDKTPLLNVFPPRNSGKFELEVFLNEPDSVSLVLLDEMMNMVYEQDLGYIREGSFPVDISENPDGVYFVRISTASDIAERRIRLKRD